MKIKERLAQLRNNYLPSIILSAILIGIVLLAIFPQTAGIISFIFVDCVVGYLYRNSIISKKTLLQIEQSDSENKFDENAEPFNSEYYDLYQEVNYNRSMVMLKSICLALSFCPLIYRYFEDDIYPYIGISLGMIMLSVFLACIFLSVGKKNEVLMELISKRKDKWRGKFTSEELEILNRLKVKK